MITIANIYLTDISSFTCIYSRDETSGDLSSPEFEGMEELYTSLGPPVLLVDPPDQLSSDLRVAKVEFRQMPDEYTDSLLISFSDYYNHLKWIAEVPIEKNTNLILLKRDRSVRGEFVEGPGYPENLKPILFGS